ncbi:MAG: pyridoxamine 5'-phosphate oxidase family protein [Candidatus Hermodarchaeia archaeon]|jgi:general stress protein 26
MSIPTVEELLRGENSIFLATAEDDQPRVRPVTLVENAGELFVLTGSKDAKVAQIKKNEKVEVVRLIRREDGGGYVRFSARAKIVVDPKIRERLAKATSFFSTYFKSADDPKFVLMNLVPVKIEYMKPGQMYPDPVDKLDFTK